MPAHLELLDRLEHTLILATQELMLIPGPEAAKAADLIWDSRALVAKAKEQIDRPRPITGEYKKLDG